MLSEDNYTPTDEANPFYKERAEKEGGGSGNGITFSDLVGLVILIALIYISYDQYNKYEQRQAINKIVHSLVL